MEEEIDLRVYISVLLKYRYWIVGLAFVAAVVALGVSFLLPPTYQATALVVITKPRYAMQFDPRFAPTNSGNIQPPYKAYPALAMGDEIIATLIEELGSKLGSEEQSANALRGMLDAKSGDDPSIVELTVKNGDPRRAADIANEWATLFVGMANELYGQSEGELAFFETQLAEAETALFKAEQDLIEFQARNEASILGAQLDNKQASLDEYLSVARSLRLIVQDAKSLQDRLRSQDMTTSASLSDELTSLLLEIDALSGSGSPGFLSRSIEPQTQFFQMSRRSELPIQLQISGQQGLGNKTVGEQVAVLDSLIQVLEDKMVILEQEARVIEPDILRLQEKVQQTSTEEERLTTAKDVARETFVSLSRKVAEVRISAQDTTGDVRLASRAAVPEKPISPRKLLNTAVAGALGLFVGIFGAFAIEYWQQGQPEFRPESQVGPPSP